MHPPRPAHRRETPHVYRLRRALAATAVVLVVFAGLNMVGVVGGDGGDEQAVTTTTVGTTTTTIPPVPACAEADVAVHRRSGGGVGHRADRHRPFTPRRLRAQRPAQHRRRRLPVHGWPCRPLPRALRSGRPASGGRRQRHPALDPGRPPQLRAAGGPVRASGRRARGRGGRQPRGPTRALGAPAGHDDRRHHRGRDRCGPVVGRDTRGPVGRHQRPRVRVPAELPVGRLRPHLLRLRALAPAVRGSRAGRGRHRRPVCPSASTSGSSTPSTSPPRQRQRRRRRPRRARGSAG